MNTILNLRRPLVHIKSANPLLCELSGKPIKDKISAATEAYSDAKNKQKKSLKMGLCISTTLAPISMVYKDVLTEIAANPNDNVLKAASLLPLAIIATITVACIRYLGNYINEIKKQKQAMEVMKAVIANKDYMTTVNNYLISIGEKEFSSPEEAQKAYKLPDLMKLYSIANKTGIEVGKIWEL